MDHLEYRHSKVEDGDSTGRATPAYSPSSSGNNINLKFNANEDPICIVGMACRLPGAIRSPCDLWDFVVQKQSAQGPIPPERFNYEGYYHADKNTSGTIDSNGGYFIEEDVRQFENDFFGINNLEATYLDPQQRKLVEVVFECFENAGVSMDEISGSNTGVYVGNFTHDYYLMQLRDPDHIHRYHGTGTGSTLLANRVSHLFNLHGPSFTLDTACSSSIYSLHVAVAALLAGECDGAVVAGVNLILTPESQIAATKTGVLSPTSTCHTFDISADGYGRAEGVNAVYLKRLSSALRDRDNICAVIRGTALNSNGRTSGVSLPSADLQEAVIRKAYRGAGLTFTETDYVECHGTGTAVGDPIEIEALGRCFSSTRSLPLMIGSVKSNLGHSEAASGLTSLIKVTLSLQRGMVLPTQGLKELNPKLQLDRLNMRVVTEAEPWPRAFRRASINSFGYGGANAHVILESFDSYMGTSESNRTIGSELGDETFVLPLSTVSTKSLELREDQICQMTTSSDLVALARLIYTLTQRRSHLKTRSYSIFRVGKQGSIMADSNNSVNWTRGSGNNPLPIAYIFTGQGAQYPGMAKELLQNHIFLTTIRQLDRVLQGLPSEYAPDWTIEEAITLMDAGQVNQVTRSQPICTAIQIGLVKVLRSWNISPSAVIGHSSGEIAAAYAAHLISASQAILAAYFRGYAVEKLELDGAMVAVGLSETAARSLIEETGLTGEIHVACVNSPESVTLSGLRLHIQALVEKAQVQNVFARLLETGGQAYHSPLMERAGTLYQTLIAPYVDSGFKKEEGDGAVDLYSSVAYADSRPLLLNSATKWSRHWRENLEKTVQFSSAMARLIEDRMFQLIEIGPHSSLKQPINQIQAITRAKKQHLPYAPSLIRKQDANLCIKTLAGTLFLQGYKLDWENVNSLSYYGPPSQDIPSYPWDYSGGLPWTEPRVSVEIRNRRHVRHELLGSQQPAGNGIQWCWRNILRLEEIPWMRDHKVDSQIVFPIAGYLVVAMEALSQILKPKVGSPHENHSFEFQNISINTALVIPDTGKGSHSGDDVELHTALSFRKLSNKTYSNKLYDFIISSWVDGQTVEHCAGSIRLSRTSLWEGTVKICDTTRYKTWPIGPWYEKSIENGLVFGPHFQSLMSLIANNDRLHSDIITTADMSPPVAKASATYYPIHPITIDACLQSAIISATAGNINVFKPYLPVFISECRIQTGYMTAPEDIAVMSTQAQKIGVSMLKASCTLRDAQERPIVDMKNVRLSMYTGKVVQEDNTTNVQTQREPIMHVRWKPDILQLDSELEDQLNEYVSRYIDDNCCAEDEVISTMGILIDLMGHKNPKIDVLEVRDAHGKQPESWLYTLDQGTAFPRYRSWTAREIGDGTNSSLEGTSGQKFDLLIMNHNILPSAYDESLYQPGSLINENGVIISRKTNMTLTSLKATGFQLLTIRDRVILALHPPKVQAIDERRFLIVARQPSTTVVNFTAFLTTFLEQSIGTANVKDVLLDQIQPSDLSPETICISLLEMENEFLATMTQEEMDLLRSITSTVKDLIWLTGASMLDHPNPNLALVNGMSRSLMMERPSLRFIVMDVGALEISAMSTTCRNLARIMQYASSVGDNEFIQSRGLVYVSRLSPDFPVNSLFRRRLQLQGMKERVELAAVHPAALCIGRTGVMDTIYFQQQCDVSTNEGPPEGLIDVDVKAVGLNAKDVYAISGRVETQNGTLALEFSGVVTAVGPNVKEFEAGDRVLVCAPHKFRTNERVPAWSAQKLLPRETFIDTAALPVVYSTALYALRDRANLRTGESVLIHSGTGALGIATITVARHIGAVVYATAGSANKREFLVRKHGVPAGNVFSSRDESFVDQLLAATNGKGVDVIVNSLVGDLMHASWRCIASFGRFIEVGKRELTDIGKLDMDIFARNVTFIAFDLSALFFSETQFYRDIWSMLLKDTIELFRSGKIKPPPITVFDVSEMDKAYHYFSSPDRIGKIVISLENPTTMIPYAPAKYQAIFDHQKAYILVGCLGGLGRSLSTWMFSRGARKFVFLGRSGCDKLQAREHVIDLEGAGAQVIVVRGDVSNIVDVKNAVAACKTTGALVGGIVQAAMGLHEELFDSMTSESWHTSVRPKWKGTWNLHTALENHDPDFFLLMSSMTGSVGVATETNYCAANAFLDAFAYWRRTQGKPAVSVGLGMVSEVGYLHENPAIETLLLRRGIQPLNEDEFLQVMDLAISGDGHNLKEHAAESHMLTGMETLGVSKLFKQGFEVTHTVMDDSRSSILVAALDARNSSTDSRAKCADLDRLNTDIPWLKAVPRKVAEFLLAEAEDYSLKDALIRAIVRRFSNLILVTSDQIDIHRSFAQFGVDSMIASEFRTWFWNTLQVDVPFLDLLSPQNNLDAVAMFAEKKLLETSDLSMP
ncbi:putative polyketide synthase [Camillea tinctor]|nr:putative polyketide synthase [Camillea tinctor]